MHANKQCTGQIWHSLLCCQTSVNHKQQWMRPWHLCNVHCSTRWPRMCLCVCTTSWRMWRRNERRQKMRTIDWGNRWLKWRWPNRLYSMSWRRPERWDYTDGTLRQRKKWDWMNLFKLFSLRNCCVHYFIILQYFCMLIKGEAVQYSSCLSFILIKQQLLKL